MIIQRRTHAGGHFGGKPYNFFIRLIERLTYICPSKLALISWGMPNIERKGFVIANPETLAQYVRIFYR
jgi:hypothetical protein